LLNLFLTITGQPTQPIQPSAFVGFCAVDLTNLYDDTPTRRAWLASATNVTNGVIYVNGLETFVPVGPAPPSPVVEGSSSPSVVVIAGATGGGVVVLGLLICCLRRKPSKDGETYEAV